MHEAAPVVITVITPAIFLASSSTWPSPPKHNQTERGPITTSPPVSSPKPRPTHFLTSAPSHNTHIFDGRGGLGRKGRGCVGLFHPPSQVQALWGGERRAGAQSGWGRVERVHGRAALYSCSRRVKVLGAGRWERFALLRALNAAAARRGKWETPAKQWKKSK